MKSYILVLILISCVFCELKEENGIYVLNDSNFQQTVKEHESMFIEFYSSVRILLRLYNHQKQPNSLRFISTLEEIVKEFNDKDIHPFVAKVFYIFFYLFVD